MAEHDEDQPSPGVPPETPPAGAHPVIWRLARALWLAHSAGADNFCSSCKLFWPCSERMAAESALAYTAFGRSEPPGENHIGDGDRPS